MSNKLRRAWFQVHLSTAIVLMFVAGGLAWANLTHRGTKVQLYSREHVDIEYDYGFPATCYTQPADEEKIIALIGLTYRHWHYTELMLNVAIALALLAVTAFVCEYLIRRREARA